MDDMVERLGLAQSWMQEPDYDDEFTLRDCMKWLDRRPASLFGAAATEMFLLREICDERAAEIDRLRQVIAACETQFRMVAHLATAPRVTVGDEIVPKWETVSAEASAGAEMCKEAVNG